MQFHVCTPRTHKCHAFGRINSLKWYNLHSLIKHQISTRNTNSGLKFCQHSLIIHQIHIRHTTSVIHFCQHSLTKHQRSHTAHSFYPPVLQTFTNKTSWHETHTHILPVLPILTNKQSNSHMTYSLCPQILPTFPKQYSHLKRTSV